MRGRMANSVRAWRERAGLAQWDLAARVQTSRQTLAAIEAGRTVPGTVLALRLAAALACRVEELFRLPGADAAVTMTARLVDTPGGASAEQLASEEARCGKRAVRVRLAIVGGRAVAVPLTGALGAVASLPEADGVVCGGRGATARVRLLAPPERLADTVVVAGCDPALPVVAAHLHRSHPRYGLAWLPSGSLQALRWLRAGAAHVAGLHYRDPRTGQENVPLVRRVLAGRARASGGANTRVSHCARVLVVGFATWEEGLIVAPGNPRGIHAVRDVARPGVTFINREEGSGARALLDAALLAAGLPAARVRGYDRVAFSHMAVAQAVALGLVDAGLGVRTAARAFGLTFVPLQRERYDLVVPAALMDFPPVQALLDAARAAAVRSELEAVGEYDTSRLGTTLAVVP